MVGHIEAQLKAFKKHSGSAFIILRFVFRYRLYFR